MSLSKLISLRLEVNKSLSAFAEVRCLCRAEGTAQSRDAAGKKLHIQSTSHLLRRVSGKPAGAFGFQNLGSALGYDDPGARSILHWMAC